MKKRDFLSVLDLSRDEMLRVLEMARSMKPRYVSRELEGAVFALIFEKQSLRTRVTFEVGLLQMGARGIYLAPGDISLGKREGVKDVALNLERWCDGIIARVYAHEALEIMAKTRIPVINALSDLEHPCQALADFLTMWEKKGSLNFTLAFVGDGNNVAHSLLLMGARLGVNVLLATPPGYEPKPFIVERAQEEARASGAKIFITNDPAEAVRDAHFVYTDVWASMGQESEAEVRKKVFAPYQVNEDLMAKAREGAMFMHCLPAHRGEEVTDEVIDAPYSIVYDQAENRLHAQKALLRFLLV
ncbi:MAG: ornithine carbamoyltransferase [candidate division WOR-3 bacterium]